MAEPEKPDSSGLELDLSFKELPKPDPSPATTSDPRMQAVRSASRLEPVPENKAPVAARDRLREGAVETLFNSVSILADVVDDFRRSDKFFKYKALVLGIWLLMSVSAFAVACPGQGPSNDIGAQLVITSVNGTTVYMVKNDSQEPWQDVEVLVNGQYRSTLGLVEKNGGSVTLSPAVLFDAKGEHAPKGLAITEIDVHVTEPSGDATLLKRGVPVN